MIFVVVGRLEVLVLVLILSLMLLVMLVPLKAVTIRPSPCYKLGYQTHMHLRRNHNNNTQQALPSLREDRLS